jgi:hypothetical protein
MKSNVVMLRKMGQFDVKQRTKDGFFNATELLSQWNEKPNNPKRDLSKFWEQDGVKSFIEVMMEEENLDTPLEVYVKSKASRGVNAGTWMHPTLFVKFAMWLNVRFEYHVIKFVADQLIQYRKDSGDSYRRMCDSLYPLFDKKHFAQFITYQALQIKKACGVTDWQTATEEQLSKRQKIEETAVILSDIVPPEECIRIAISKTVEA